MTARDRLNAARLRQDPPHVIARLEQATIADEMPVICPCPPLWPWLLLALAAGIVAGATLVPNAEPIAEQVADGGE